MLSPEMFPEFYYYVFGYEPFPWQTRLLNEVLRDNRWPSIISVPTGAGKTSVIEIAVYALACGAHVPRKTVLVVDRRLVVDAAFERAKVLRNALLEEIGEDSVIGEVSRSLKTLGGYAPLDIGHLRGGMYQETQWVKDPSQPMVLCSTVDQVGSRILFRGYGVSASMHPIHAGLLGNDTLFILDEAHISEPFRQTMAWIEKLRSVAEIPITSPFQFVTMSATITAHQGADVFGLSDADYDHPVLKRRLENHKTLAFRTETRRNLSKGIADEVLQVVESGKTILVVVNRVLRAREVAEIISERAKKKKIPGEVIVLTGRSRPLDRLQILDRWKHRLFSGRDRAAVKDQPALVVVATQTIEVGADIDADALITEACPVDALLQRAGRLDRLGELESTHIVMVAESDLDTKPVEKLNDPVYGSRIAKTWQWLRTLGNDIDLGPRYWHRRLKSLDPHETADLSGVLRNAPVLFPAYCDILIQTRPAPDYSPDLSLFLHGSDESEPDVYIVWRTDLVSGMEGRWIDTIAILPPMVSEAVAIPLSIARSWLVGAPVGEIPDVTPETSDKNSRDDASEAVLPWIIWHGPEESIFTNDPTVINPGDTLIVSSLRGGLDGWGWNGQTNIDSENIPVKDIAELSRCTSGRPPVLRLIPQVCKVAQFHLPNKEDEQAKENLLTVLPELLQYLAIDVDVDESVRRIAWDIKTGGWVLKPHPCLEGWVLLGNPTGKAQKEASTESDIPQCTGLPVLLSGHHERVSVQIGHFAASVGLSPELEKDLTFVGKIHDLGKLDPRFQTLLWGGNTIKTIRSPALAKSTERINSRSEYTKVRARSGYPTGMRHELLSLALASDAKFLRQKVNDWDLVLHLVATHHGWCRPIAPIFEDENPRVVTTEIEGYTVTSSTTCEINGFPAAHVGSGVTERFWRVVRRYGWWGTAYLEALVRLADHRVSEFEAQGEPL